MGIDKPSAKGEGDVIFELMSSGEGKQIGIAKLNAEQSLNALNLNMIKLLKLQLSRWQRDSAVVCVILAGSGDRAFCAGGDLRQIYRHMQGGKATALEYGRAFFKIQYQLDYLIHTFGKPVICLGSGIVMGGGLGLMAGASHRIVTETTLMAMPEVTIGLFPDVGATWFLNRMPGCCGLFMGITGARIKAADALFLGLADYYLSEGQLAEVVKNITQIKWTDLQSDHHYQLSELLNSSQKAVPEVAYCWRYFEQLQKAFVVSKPPEIFHNLKALQQELSWLDQPVRTLEKGCPASVWLVTEQLRRGRHMSLKQVFDMELQMALHSITTSDLAEGIRALLVEKTGAPVWADSSLDEVPCSRIANYFTAAEI